MKSASHALALLLQETGAQGGFLFGIRNRALVCLGSHDDSEPSPEMQRAAEDYAADGGTAMEMTMTLMSGADSDRTRWMIDGRIYHPLPPACQWKEEQCLAGVVSLEAREEGELPVPHALLTALAEHLAKAGDTNPISWLDC